MPSPRSGRYRMLNTYTTTSTREQDELRPLRRVAEEQAQLLEHQLAPQRAERREQPHDRCAGRSRPARKRCAALLRLAEPVDVEPAMQQRAEHDGRRGGATRAGRTAARRPGTAASSSPRAAPTRSAGTATSGVRRTVTKSTSERNPSGRASRSGRTRRNSRTMPPAASTAMTLRMSRVRRAGKTFTSTSVIALPITAGMMRNGTKTAIAMSGNSQPAVDTRCRTRRTSGSPSARPSSSNGRMVSSSFAPYRLQPVDRARRRAGRGRLREEEARQRRDDVRQQQDREEPDEDQPEQLAGEEGPDLLDAAEIHAAAR